MFKFGRKDYQGYYRMSHEYININIYDSECKKCGIIKSIFYRYGYSYDFWLKTPDSRLENLQILYRIDRELTCDEVLIKSIIE